MKNVPSDYVKTHSYRRKTRAALCMRGNLVNCCINNANRSRVYLKCTFCNSHLHLVQSEGAGMVGPWDILLL